MSYRSTFAAACAAITLSFQPGFAAEETLSFKLVTRTITEATHSDAKIEGLSLGAGQAVGVAVFDDGRIAYKEYVFLSYEGENAPEQQPGFSSYVFENGDSFQVSFTYGPSGDAYVVNYTVLSGTGAYAGATGSGQIAFVPTEWDEATLWEGAITVVTP